MEGVGNTILPSCAIPTVVEAPTIHERHMRVHNGYSHNILKALQFTNDQCAVCYSTNWRLIRAFYKQLRILDVLDLPQGQAYET
jgi:hypothetical protein